MTIGGWAGLFVPLNAAPSVMARLVRAIRFALTHRCAATHRRVSVWEEETMKADVELLIPHFTFAGDVYPGGPVEVATFPFKDRMESAARAGFKGVGLQHADVMWNAERLGLKEMRRILEANGLKYLELEFLVDWFADGDKRRASDAMRAEMLTICAELGVRNIKAGADFSTPHADVLRMAEAFAGLCRDTARSGSEATLEIMPFSNVRTLETGLAIVSAADQPNGGLLLDIWHMGRGNTPIRTSIRFRRASSAPPRSTTRRGCRSRATCGRRRSITVCCAERATSMCPASCAKSARPGTRGHSASRS
jgi:hypothetical protein